MVSRLALVLAVVAILGWLFAEWLIIGLCGGVTTCPSRSWAGHYVPLQAILALAGMSSCVWLILRVLEKRPLQPAVLALLVSAGLWAVVVQVQASS